MSTEPTDRYFCPECGVVCHQMTQRQINLAPVNPMLFGMRIIADCHFAVHPVPSPSLPCKGAIPQCGKVAS